MHARGELTSLRADLLSGKSGDTSLIGTQVPSEKAEGIDKDHILEF